jgi:tetratricopeptide (TPR) repeat protein
MALFGAPIAHEDDAERAVRAALQMQATLAEYANEIRIPVRMRIGINSGEVLVGALRAGGEYTAMGDTVNVAARLQTMAAPGQVLVGPATHDQTADVVHYDSLGAVEARGRGELVDAYAARETLVPPGHRRRRARTPLIGRDQEMGILCSAIRMAFERRRPQLVMLTGDAGIGKSRLAEELTANAASEHSATVLEGRCVPYGEANVWWPIATAIRQALGVGLGDTAEEAQDKTRSKVAWGLRRAKDDSDVQRVVDGLSYLMGIPSALTEMEPARAREGAVHSFVGLLQNMANRKPVVLALSELHWADQLVLDLVESLPDRLRNLPFALVATSRPELAERWAPTSGRHNVVSLHLDPLDRAGSVTLLTALLEGTPEPALVDAVLDRSGGNPFFLEELAALVHHTGPPGELPATLRALVATRVDNLPAPERRLLDHAAVIGRLGSIESLTALGPVDGALRRNLDALVSRDLLAVDGAQWVFRSDLVREVAYETMTKGERARLHARLGAFLRQQAKERGRQDEQLEALAHHFGLAAELDRELGGVEGVPADILDEALTWYDRAIAQAEQRETAAPAEQLSTRALELVPEDRPEDRRRFLVRRADARASLRRLDEARTDVATVLTEAEAAGDGWAAAGAVTVRGKIEQSEGALYESAANLDDAIARWQALGDRAGEATARRLRGMTDLFLGRLTSAEANIASALTLFKELGDRRGEAWAQQNMAWISTSSGDPEEAKRRIGEAVRLFSEIGDLAGLGWAYGLLGWVRLSEGYLEEADQLAHRVLDNYDSGGDPWAEGMMRLLMSTTSLWLGRTDDAVESGLRAREAFASIEDATGELRAVATLSRALLAAGKLRQARELMTTASALASGSVESDGRDMGRLITAGTAVQLGEAGEVFSIGELLEPRGTAPESTGLPVDLEVPRGLALLHLGRDAQAVAILRDAYSRARGPGAVHAAGAALALANAVTGDADGAIAVADEADAVEQGTYLDRVGAALGRGFGFVRLGRHDEGRAALEGAVASADATGDRLNQALSRLALSWGLAAMGAPDAESVRADARERLEAMGLPDTEWDGVYRRAAGEA